MFQVKTSRLLTILAGCSLVGCGSSTTGDAGHGDANRLGAATGGSGAGLGGSTGTGATAGTLVDAVGGASGAAGTAAPGAGGAGGLTGTGGTVAPGAGGAGGLTGTGGRTGTGARDAGRDGPPGTGGRGATGGSDVGADGSTGTGGAGGILDGGPLAGEAGVGRDTGTGEAASAGSVPAGWLYTVPKDNKIYLSDGASGTVWMGRGVNIDDLFLCGYNYQLQMTNPTGEAALLGILSNLMTEWKPTFLRTSLGMNSYTVVSWLASSTYKNAMTNVINKIGTYPGAYVLVTLRSDTTMVNTDGSVCGQGDDAVCMPSTATDDVYRELVASFASAPFVIFGIANEPGGMSAKDVTLSGLMSHAVGVIRAAEDTLGVPHHLVAVQGNQWTSKIGFYNTAPLPYDNVVYEYHAYPPEATGTYGYTQSSIPVIIGEYGPDGSDQSFLSAFLADVEAKQIPNIAWSLSPYSDCAPDLVSVTRTTTLSPNTWGTPIKQYLLSH
jgi:hypothetical protein